MTTVCDDIECYGDGMKGERPENSDINKINSSNVIVNSCAINICSKSKDIAVQSNSDSEDDISNAQSFTSPCNDVQNKDSVREINDNSRVDDS